MSDDRDRCPRVRGTAEYCGRVRSPFERQSPRLGVGPVWRALASQGGGAHRNWGCLASALSPIAQPDESTLAMPRLLESREMDAYS